MAACCATVFRISARLRPCWTISRTAISSERESCVRPNTTIGSAIGIDDLFRDGYRAIFIGTGVWQPARCTLRARRWAMCILQSITSTIRTASAWVSVSSSSARAMRPWMWRAPRCVAACGSSPAFSRTPEVAASQHEFSYATLEGVNFEYCKAPVEITDEGVIFVDVREDENGEFIEAPGTEKLYPADSVIVSISQGPRNRIVSTTKGIDTDRRGLLVTDEEGHTTRPGVFLPAAMWCWAQRRWYRLWHTQAGGRGHALLYAGDTRAGTGRGPDGAQR